MARLFIGHGRQLLGQYSSPICYGISWVAWRSCFRGLIKLVTSDRRHLARKIQVLAVQVQIQPWVQVSPSLREMPKPAHSFYVRLSFLSLTISTQVVHPSSFGITYKVSTEKRASLYGKIYLSILWRLSWTNIPLSKSTSSILNRHYESFMKVELFYQRTFSSLPFSMGWKSHTVSGRLLSAHQSK